MGPTEGGEKPRLHLKDKFFETKKQGENRLLSITVRQRDGGPFGPSRGRPGA